MTNIATEEENKLLQEYAKSLDQGEKGRPRREEIITVLEAIKIKRKWAEERKTEGKKTTKCYKCFYGYGGYRKQKKCWLTKQEATPQEDCKEYKEKISY